MIAGQRRSRNAAVVRRYLMGVWRDGDVALLDQLLSDSFRDHDAPPGYSGDLAGHRRLVQELTAGMLNRSLHLTAEVSDGDLVAVRYETGWTQRGPFLGVEADGARLTLRALDLYRVRAGRITESWHCEDIAGVLRQAAAARTA
jgi:predicted ester cyclase